MNTPIIELKNISKEFQIPHERRNSIKEYFLNFPRKTHFDCFSALQNINLTINKGDWIGIIGSNGSGKSTLLKIIAGIYEPNRGSLNVNGKIVPFLELGVGFNPELSARDNIFLNGTILGMTRKKISEKFDEMVDFAGIRKFLDQKLKNFSSGMQLRLAFSIAMQSNGDIYLLDEVLSVGDYEFQQKTRKTFEDMKREGKTVILVSHDLDSIKNICDKAILLDRGQIKTVGKPSNVINDYIGASDRLRWESECMISNNFIDYENKNKNSLDRKIKFLKKNLDKQSQKLIKQIPERFQYISENSMLNNALFDIDEIEERKKINIEDYKKIYALDQYEIQTFHFHNGLKLLPIKTINSLKNTDVIDAGAYNGDSAIIFNKEYEFNKIYSFEPQPTNFLSLKSNIEKYNLKNVIAINNGLGSKKYKTMIKNFSSASYVTADGDHHIEITTIDDFVKETGANIGLIKMDIEGMEYDAIIGATETIKKFKPILLISLYHNGKDFFEIKPYLESITDGYQFMVRKLNPYHLTFETMLIGWPQKNGDN